MVPRLRRLKLSFDAIGRAGALALARARGFDGLQHLVLIGNDVGPDARRILTDRFGDRVLL